VCVEFSFVVCVWCPRNSTSAVRARNQCGESLTITIQRNGLSTPNCVPFVALRKTRDCGTAPVTKRGQSFIHSFIHSYIYPVLHRLSTQYNMGKRRWNGSNLLGHPSPQRRRRRHQTACDEFDSNILHNVKQQSSLHAFFGVKTRPSPMEVRSRSRCTPTIVGTPPTPKAELQRCRQTPPTSTAHPPPSTPVTKLATPVGPEGKTQRVRKKTQQLYLDCGQRDFGSRSVCATCGMLYVHGLVEDAIQHARICQDYIQGVPFAIPTSTLSSFWSTQDLSIHAIQSTSKRMVRLGTVPERLIVEVRR
jgi:hypothetical protein